MRSIHRLTALRVQREAAKGVHADGGGLYLQVSKSGSKSWFFRFQRDGKVHDMGLGALITITLAEAREKATDARRLLTEGKDPLAAKRALRSAAAKVMSFDECADQFLKAHAAGWRSTHAQQWAATVKTYASPIIGGMDVRAIETADIMRVLGDVWKEKPLVASRLRGRLEKVLDWAKVRGYRDGDNVARWRGHLDHLLPALRKVHTVEHYAALPYAEIAAFMVELRSREGVSERALEVAILTATRTGEVLGARWDEIDLDKKLWTIPASRTKALREHRVPLADRALEILAEMQVLIERRVLNDNGFIFPGRRGSLGKDALEKVVRRVREGVTPHGFRSTFRDWCSEATNTPSEAAEMALGHAVGNKVEAAYRRGDLMERRRDLMAAWARFCDGPDDPVVVVLKR